MAFEVAEQNRIGLDEAEFVEAFPALAEAAGGTGGLRQVVLDLAVRGQLTGREQSGEHGQGRLDANHRAALLAAADVGYSRACAQSGVRPNASSAAPTERWRIPQAWTWTTLGRLFPISSGTTPARTRHEYFGGSVAWVKTTDLNNAVVTTSEEFVTSDAMRECGLRLYRKGTVCVAMYGGAGTIGKTGILGIDATINQSVCALVPNLVAALPSFVHLYLKAIRDTWMEFAAGLRVAANINAGAVRNMAIPLPPLAEQKRIVTRVDQLMALIEDLEGKQTKKRELSTRFTKASLEALTTAESPEEFSAAWKRVVENVSTVIDRADKVGELRRAIFGIACRGVLTARGAGSGQEVLQSISARRLDWVAREGDLGGREAERHLQKLAVQPELKGELRLPDNWAWSSLLACCWQLVDCHNKTAPYTSHGVALVRTSNIREGKVKLDGAMRISETTYERWSRRCPPEPGDVLFTREAPTGEVGLIESGMRICMGQRMMLLRSFSDLIDPKFLVLALRDPAFQLRMFRAAVGTTVTICASGTLRH